MFKQIWKMLLIVLTGLLVTACGSQVKLYDDNNQPVTQGSSNESSNTGLISPHVDVSSQVNEDKVIPELNDNLVFFDFDSYLVKEEFYPLITLHAKYLLSHPSQKVFVEGHTDALGSSEYNLALGQRRSEAVRKMLLSLGVNDDQIEAISYGKEKPLTDGNSEADLAKNRRAKFSYR